ncbi:MAG: aminoglycoside phosphotransferase family protein [Nocardioides sp.]|nr:aminoglycoside phosphotransferase family protein [Nocardioides sp.]
MLTDAPGVPDVAGYRDVRTVVGGNSHEVFRATTPEGREVILRVYGARHRGPEAPGVHASVLMLVRGLVPAPELLEVRGPEAGTDGLVVTSVVPGVVLDDVLATCDDHVAARLGRSLGEALGRMSGIAMTGPGDFLDYSLGRRVWQPGSESLVTWLDLWSGRAPLADLGAPALARLRRVCAEADAILAAAPRACLVHGDLSPRNVMCDPATGVITGLIDWEFAHAGHPMEDAGHQVRERPDSVFSTALLEAMNRWLPPAEQADVETLRRRARAADLYWIIEIASRLGEASATYTCHRILSAIAASGDLLGDTGS